MLPLVRRLKLRVHCLWIQIPPLDWSQFFGIAIFDKVLASCQPDPDLIDYVSALQVGADGGYIIESLGGEDTIIHLGDCNRTNLACTNDSSSILATGLFANRDYYVSISSRSLEQPDLSNLGVRISSVLDPPEEKEEDDNEDPEGIPPIIENNNNIGILAGGVSGALLLSAVSFYAYQRRRRHSFDSSESGHNTALVKGSPKASFPPWTPTEDRLLKAQYDTTQDFEQIYPFFPLRSKEDVAGRIRQTILRESNFYRMSPSGSVESSIFIQSSSYNPQFASAISY